jgi:hypothetical protein
MMTISPSTSTALPLLLQVVHNMLNMPPHVLLHFL